MNNRSKKEYAYTLLDCDAVPAEEVLSSIKEIEGVIRLRILL